MPVRKEIKHEITAYSLPHKLVTGLLWTDLFCEFCNMETDLNWGKTDSILKVSVFKWDNGLLLTPETL